MNDKPISGKPQRFLSVKTLAKKLGPLGASLEGTGEWRLVVPFQNLEGLKDKRRMITTVLRRYKGLVDERLDLLDVVDGDGLEAGNKLTRARA